MKKICLFIAIFMRETTSKFLLRLGRHTTKKPRQRYITVFQGQEKLRQRRIARRKSAFLFQGQEKLRQRRIARRKSVLLLVLFE
ncbi:hypothetical protein [Virgibacillus proomii]|uniref:hypothetical protein n=1 Tax=Virgibacillus proomii TaxID=84407 RepID=UPI001C129345|nr:hypothetical protein [Virgibacillus proomii]MBU5266096.1 hypothetical protein [Virgibacillus proomii]